MEKIAFFVTFALFIILTIATFPVAQYLTRYRTDIRPGQAAWTGRSWLVHQNTLSRANYTAEGQKKVRWLVALNVVQLLMLAAAFVFFSLAFFY